MLFPGVNLGLANAGSQEKGKALNEMGMDAARTARMSSQSDSMDWVGPGKEYTVDAKSGLTLLFDLSFSEFVTTKLIKILFLIGIGLAGIGSIGLIVSGFVAGVGWGLLFLILSPVVFMLLVLLSRISCELILVLFRVAENTSKIANQDK